jgi:hypothetical protein
VAFVRRLIVAVLVSILVAAGLAVPGAALAHSDIASVATPGASAVADAPLSLPVEVRAAPARAAHPLGLLAGMVAGVLLAVGRRRPRCALVLLLALLLAVFAVENGIHSVHHLGERAASCAIAAAAGHLVVAMDDGAPLLHARVVVAPLPADRSAGLPSGPSLGRDPARAPPALIA